MLSGDVVPNHPLQRTGGLALLAPGR